jgi:EAL and modified HD-GYP domain-containing signal transduction protein
MVRTLFGSKPSSAHAARAGAVRPKSGSLDRLDEVAPLKQAAQDGDDRPAQGSFVCREAVLSRHERIAGYEFSLERRLHSRFMDERDTVRRIYDDLLIGSLASFEVDRLLGHRLAFIDVSPSILLNPRLARLPAKNTVLMLVVPPAVQIDPVQLRVQIDGLQERGFQVGWRWQLERATTAVALEACDFVQVLTSAFDGLQLSDFTAQGRSHPRTGREPLKFIASDIATADDFQLCYRAGFDYFQGPFVTSRENWHPPKSDIDRAKVILILNRLRSGAQTSELAKALRCDPVLTYKMLRYINSPAMGLRKQITEIEQALVLLGQDKLYRWLSLLLYDVKGAGYAEHALFEQALVRARLMEQLALRSGLASPLADQLFLTGLFSLLDKMLGLPTEQILAKVAVTNTVRDALLHARGPFFPYLQLGVACEAGAPEEIAGFAARCGLEPGGVNHELICALTWANEIGELSR